MLAEKIAEWLWLQCFTDKIRVDRLLWFVDPIAVLAGNHGIKSANLHAYVRSGTTPCVPRPYEEMNDRPRTSWEWDTGRVRWFVDAARRGENLEPVEVDNIVDAMRLYEPILLDGHHRLLAHMVLRRKWIRAHYGGRTDTLRFLKGRGRCPLDLLSFAIPDKVPC